MWQVIRAPETTFARLGTCMCTFVYSTESCIALTRHCILVSGFTYKPVAPFASLATSMRQGILIVSFTVRSSHCWQMLSSFSEIGKVTS